MRGCVYGLPISIALSLAAVAVIQYLLARPALIFILFAGVFVVGYGLHYWRKGELT